MIKRVIYIFSILFLSSTLNAFGQAGNVTNKKDSSSDLKIESNTIQSQFKNIHSNLLQVSGKNTLEEGIEYYNLGELFMEQKQPSLAKSYYLESLEIYKQVVVHAPESKKTKRKSKRYKQITTTKKTIDDYKYKAYIGVVKACLADLSYKEALNYTRNLDGLYTGIWAYDLLKLDVLQANEEWKEILELCDVLEQKKHPNTIDSILINKRTLAKAKLGLEEETLPNIESDKALDMNSIEEVYLDDAIEEDVQEIVDPVLQIKGLSYETQDEIANTYNKKSEFEKELNIRNNITKDKTISEKQKAKQKLEIGKLYSKTSKKDEAISALKESLVLAKESGDFLVQKETILKLIDLYENKKDGSNALVYYKQLRDVNHIQDSLNQEKYDKMYVDVSNVYEQVEAIDNIADRRDIYQKERNLESKENQLMESQMQFQKNIIACLIFGLLIAVFVVFWYHKQKQKLTMVNLQLELKNMRNQMNPHFIFNSLNAVNHFIAQRNELLANEYLTEFALLMRNTLNQSDIDLIPLRDELTFLNRYCELEKMRFESKFDFTFTVDPKIDIDAFQIPPLLLQPFVENAVWHGLRYLENKGQLDVSFTSDGNQLKIEIVDNGIGREKSKSIKTDNQKKHKSKGVSLIKRRIHISNQLTPIYIDWKIEDLSPQGTRVVLILNKK